MKLSHIVYKELWQRKGGTLASFTAVLLGVAVIVAVQTIGISSNKKISGEIHHLGSNILILPQDTKVSDYYTADFGTKTIPEQHIHILHTSEFSEKVHEMIPKYSVRIELKGDSVILTGILPKDEFTKKPAWRMKNFFLEEEQKIQRIIDKDNQYNANEGNSQGGDLQEYEVPTLKYEQKSKRKAFESIGLRDIMLGSETARILELQEGDELEIKGRYFRITQVLEETGTVDDIRIFAHLHTVQDITGAEDVINAIEVVGCGCTKDLVGLGQDIEKLLPGTKVITIRDLARAQTNTISMMKKLSWVLSAIALVIGGASIANYMFANVYERRMEIGTLMAMGATPWMVLSIFLRKAVLLGISGGISGYLAGTGLALVLGPLLLKVEIFPQVALIGWSLVIAVVLNVICSFIPAKQAASLDPAVVLQEE